MKQVKSRVTNEWSSLEPMLAPGVFFNWLWMMPLVFCCSGLLDFLFLWLALHLQNLEHLDLPATLKCHVSSLGLINYLNLDFDCLHDPALFQYCHFAFHSFIYTFLMISLVLPCSSSIPYLIPLVWLFFHGMNWEVPFSTHPRPLWIY